MTKRRSVWVVEASSKRPKDWKPSVIFKTRQHALQGACQLRRDDGQAVSFGSLIFRVIRYDASK